MILKVADLFCGMGGLGLGFRRAGFDVTGYDIDPRACGTYEANNVGKAISQDLMREDPSGDFDVVVGGPPCEPWSCLNVKSRGSDHPLAACIGAFFRAVRELSPRLFIMENVIPLAQDPILRNVLNGVKRVGYRTHLFKIRYSNYGAAISRRRLFVIGVHGALRFGPTDVIAEIPRSNPKTVKDVIWDLRFKEWDPSIQHMWPRAATIERYKNFYARGKYGWYTLRWDRPSPSFGNVAKTYVLHPAALDGGPMRPISVREAMRIMGFPDTFTFPPGVSMSRKYEMVAEAVPPDFSVQMAKAVLKLLGGGQDA